MYTTHAEPGKASRAASRRCLGWGAGTASRCMLLSHFLTFKGKDGALALPAPSPASPRAGARPHHALHPRPRPARRGRRYLGDHVLAGQQQGAQQVLPAVIPQGVDGHLGRSRGRRGPLPLGGSTCRPRSSHGPGPLCPPRPHCPLPGASQSSRFREHNALGPVAAQPSSLAPRAPRPSSHTAQASAWARQAEGSRGLTAGAGEGKQLQVGPPSTRSQTFPVSAVGPMPQG